MLSIFLSIWNKEKRKMFITLDADKQEYKILIWLLIIKMKKKNKKKKNWTKADKQKLFSFFFQFWKNCFIENCVENKYKISEKKILFSPRSKNVCVMISGCALKHVKNVTRCVHFISNWFNVYQSKYLLLNRKLFFLVNT